MRRLYEKLSGVCEIKDREKRDGKKYGCNFICKESGRNGKDFYRRKKCYRKKKYEYFKMLKNRDKER